MASSSMNSSEQIRSISRPTMRLSDLNTFAEVSSFACCTRTVSPGVLVYAFGPCSRPRMANFTVKPPSNWPRVIGGVLINVGISLLVAYVANKLMQRINDSIIRRRMEEFRPELEKSLEERHVRRNSPV
jgi:hypothetical protein